MLSVHQFNGLGGTTATREQLVEIQNNAINDGNEEIVSRIDSLLALYPKAKIFEDIQLDDHVIEPVPESFLAGLDYEQPEDETEGLGRVSPAEVYDMITAKVVKMIAEATLPSYKKKWQSKEYGTGYTIPFNFVTKKRYRGVNVVMLTELEPMENPYFLTFKQVNDLKGKVKKGAKGFEVVYFTKIWKAEDKPKNLKFSSYDKTKVETFKTENAIENDLGVIPMLKYYHVYNGRDIEGIDFGLSNFKMGFIDVEKPSIEANRMPIPEAILKNYPKPQPTLKFGGNKAFYRPGTDHVQMPYLADFETVQDYYRTLLHEFSHSTGASSRLKRDFSGKFGSKPYALEELTAELGAIFLSAEAGIIWHNNTNHAAYLKSWNAALTQIKDDNKFIMRASTAAQKVADFVLQFDENGDPLYFNDLKKVVEKKNPFKLSGAEQKKIVEKYKKLVIKKTPVAKKLIKKIVLTKSQKARYDKELASDNWKKYSKTLGKKVTKKTVVDPVAKKVTKVTTTKKPVSKVQEKTKETVLGHKKDSFSTPSKPKTVKKQPVKKVANVEKKSIITLKTFEEFAKNSKTVEEFITKIYETKNVPNSVAVEFRNIYGLNNESSTEAAKNMWKKFHKIEVIQTSLFGSLSVPITGNIEEIFSPEPETIFIPEPVQEPKEVPPVKNKLMQMHFESLPMDQGWENFMQNPAKNMKIAIWGPPKNGKTAGALQMANYLTKFGTVLYNFADQGFNLSTQELWKSSGLASNPKAVPSDASTLDELEKELATGKYEFCFLDMISDYIRKEKITPEEFKTRFIKGYPNTSFILIFEVTKGGNFKGDQGWTHVVDAIVTVEDFLMENRGRYGMGYHIVWDDGLKRYNPKRYDEIKEFLEPKEEVEFTQEVERL